MRSSSTSKATLQVQTIQRATILTTSLQSLHQAMPSFSISKQLAELLSAARTVYRSRRLEGNLLKIGIFNRFRFREAITTSVLASTALSSLGPDEGARAWRFCEPWKGFLPSRVADRTSSQLRYITLRIISAATGEREIYFLTEQQVSLKALKLISLGNSSPETCRPSSRKQPDLKPLGKVLWKGQTRNLNVHILGCTWS